jgi:hypothetical protein
MNLTSEDHFNSLEEELGRSLRRVQPNPEFVNRLHSNLVTPATMVLEKQRSPAYNLAVFMVGLGLAVGLLLVWIVRQMR